MILIIVMSMLIEMIKDMLKYVRQLVSLVKQNLQKVV